MENLENILKVIKKDFFCYRNGAIADSLRKLYRPGTIIYGLIVPQFIEISQKYPKDLELGMALWEDKNIRESRLLALYILPPYELDKENVKKMILDVESVEEAEFLAFRILRHLPYAKDLYEEIAQLPIEGTFPLYCLKMFKSNLA